MSFFPRPHLGFYQCRFAVPDTVNGTLISLTAYPKLLPLLIGRLRFAKIDIATPEIEILSEIQQKSSADGATRLSFQAVEEKIGSILGVVPANARGLIFQVENGRASFHVNKNDGLWFQDIYARIELPADQIILDIRCSSSLWEGISLKGILDPKRFKSDGEVKLINVHPQLFTQFLPPHLSWKVSSCQLNLDVQFKTDGLNLIQGGFQGTMPYLTLRRGAEELTLKTRRFKGGAFHSEDKLNIFLEELALLHPGFTLSGKLDIDRSPQPASHSVGLELRANSVDVDSTRKVALALAGKIPVVQDIFRVVKGGEIPFITFTAGGNLIQDLGELENMQIQGRMVDGVVSVPGVDLDLTQVKGDVFIAKGILHGETLEARWDNSRASSGSLTLGLVGDNPQFHLDMAVEADLAQVPVILKKVVDNKVFLQKMAYIQNVKGNASGRLVLGERMDAVRARVAVSQFNLSYDDQRLPFPVIINSGQYFLKGSETFAKNLRGSVGKSSFSSLSVQVRWDTSPYLKVESGRTELFLEQIFPWLLSSKAIAGKLQSLKHAQGVVVLSAVSLDGPISTPEKFQYQIAGSVQDLSLTTSGLSGEVFVSKGHFNATPAAFSFSDCKGRIMDAELIASGTVENYQKNVNNVDITFHGKMGPNAVDRISDGIKLPPQFDLKNPVLVSDAHLTWRNQQETAFSGLLTLPQELSIDTNVRVNSEELLIEKLNIMDGASNASITLGYKNRTLNFSFNGDLDKATLDKLMKENKILGGRINGDFHANIFLDQPVDSTIQGDFHINDLVLPNPMNAPFAINTLSLKAEGNHFRVESGDLSLADNRFDLKGNVTVSPKGFNLDMGLTADVLNLDKLTRNLNKNTKENHGPSGKGVWSYPIRGVLKLKSNKLSYAGVTWDPFQADIGFSDKAVTISVIDANLCGIDTPGIVKLSPQTMEVSLKPAAENQELQALQFCLLDKSVKVDGKFSLQANLSTHGTQAELIRALSGDLEVTAPEGRYYAGRTFSVFTKIFGLLNLSDLYKGKLPDITKEGFGYNSMRLKADIQNGTLYAHEVVIDGTSMGIVCRGSIDLASKQVDGTILVAPLKTVDAVVRKIPGINYILGGTLVSIPFSIKGHPNNLSVIPLSPSAIGSGLQGIMKRTLQLPVKIIQPVLSDEKK